FRTSLVDAAAEDERLRDAGVDRASGVLEERRGGGDGTVGVAVGYRPAVRVGRGGTQDLRGVRGPVVRGGRAVLADDDVRRHEVDAARAAAAHGDVRVGDRVLDVGSGNGVGRVADACRVEDLERLDELQEARVEPVNRVVALTGRDAGGRAYRGAEALQHSAARRRGDAHDEVRASPDGD